MQIFVIGMHRSGTSMVARLMNLMGAYFGPEGISTGAGQENPKGFWERKDVRALNDQILHAANAGWYQVSDFALENIPPQDLEAIHQKLQRLILELDAHRPWFLKEPRFCLTFPLWRDHLEFPICIHIHRSPIQIAQSLKTRNGFPLHFGIALWEKYTLESLKVTRDCPRLLISHAELIQQPLPTVATLYQQLTELGCQGLRLPDEKEILAFITPGLHRERGTADLESSFINQRQAQLIAAFAAGRILDPAPDLAALDLSPGAWEILRVEETSKQQKAQSQASLDQLNQTLHEKKAIENALTQENRQLKAALQIKGQVDFTDLQKKLTDTKQLQYWVSQFSKNAEAVLQSWRWRIGDFLVRLVEIALFRPKPTLASDHLRTLIRQLQAWPQRGNAVPEPAAPRSSIQNGPASSIDRVPRQSGTADGRATVIVCIHNALAEVRACLESIGKHTNLRYHELILVDDGSDASTRRLVVEYAAKLGAKTVRNENALGYTKAANQGLRMARGNYCLLLNSDTLVTSGWLERLIHCIALHPRTACVGPLSNAASWQSIPNLMTETGEWRVNELPEGMSLDEYARRIAMHSPRLYPQVTFINGFCYLIRRAALDNLGYLDEATFPKGYGEEDDFSVRAQDAGWALRIADDCYVYHAKSKSFTPQVRTEITSTTKSALQTKHGKPKIGALLQQIQHNELLLIARTLAKIATQSLPDLNTTDLALSTATARPLLRIGWLQPHLNVVGGIRRAIEMTNRLVALGFEATLITPSGEKTDWLPISAQVINTDDAKTMRFDVLIVSDPDVYSFFAKIAAGLRINYHLAPYYQYRNPDRNLEHYYRGSSEKSPIHHVANSKWTADNAKSAYGVHNEGVFPGGINPYLFFPHNEEKTYDVVFYGSERLHKGSATILSATSNLQTLSLATLDAQQEDLARHISKGRVFASACWHEGFNFCPLEAMACGVPVAMTDDGGSREYAVDRENALVVPVKDPQALREAIHELLENKPLRLRLIENGLLTAARYTWDRVTINFAELILKLHAEETTTGSTRN